MFDPPSLLIGVHAGALRNYPKISKKSGTSSWGSKIGKSLSPLPFFFFLGLLGVRIEKEGKRLKGTTYSGELD
ncbi:hypothetical protein [Brevundimonas sp. TWP1-2-1b1]|uniref:hypothetical protein n=1 Tax=unclassified Brevundimonas TaxID=2622653 RepID=UPI003CEAD4B1